MLTITHGMATLVKQHSLYYSQFYNKNRSPQRKRIPLHTRTKRIALMLHRELEDKVATGKYDPWFNELTQSEKSPITKDSSLNQVLDFYINKKSREDWRTTTKINTSYVLRDFIKFLGVDNSVQSITPASVNRYLNRKKYAFETKKSHMSKIKTFGRWLKKEEIIAFDCSYIKIFNNDHEQEDTISYVSQSEIDQLKEGIRQKVTNDIDLGYQKVNRNALWLLDFIDWQRYSGMRISETLNLTSESINLNTWEVTIGSDLFSTKSKSKQILPIDSVKPLKSIILKLLKECSHPNDRLFQHKDRSKVSKLFKKYVRIYLPNREDVHVHTLRHTCCIELLRKGVPIYTVQRWMRHSSIHTTQKYADLLAIDISKAVGAAFTVEK